MGLVTDHARCHGVVGDRVDLRKPRGSGRVVCVTTLTERPLPGDPGLGFNRIRDVARGRAVAGLTAQVAVVARQTLIHDTAVTQSALLLAGVLLLVTKDGVDCRRAVMTELAESIGDEKLSGHDKRHDDQDEGDDKDGYLRWQRLTPKLR